MRPIPKAHHPGERLPYRASIPPGDALASAAWASDPLGPRIDPPEGTNTSSVSNVFVSDIQAGTKYRLRCTMTGTSGGVYVQDLWIQGVA